jgi:uncharacterized membrane protein
MRLAASALILALAACGSPEAPAGSGAPAESTVPAPAEYEVPTAPPSPTAVTPAAPEPVQPPPTAETPTTPKRPPAPKAPIAPPPLPKADTPASTAAVEATTPLRLVGTEPFWGGRIAADGITLSGADRPDMRFPADKPWTRGAAAVWATQSSGALPLKITLRVAACSDGMSDRRYPYTALVEVGGETLRGCALPERDFGGGR